MLSGGDGAFTTAALTTHTWPHERYGDSQLLFSCKP